MTSLAEIFPFTYVTLYDKLLQFQYFGAYPCGADVLIIYFSVLLALALMPFLGRN